MEQHVIGAEHVRKISAKNTYELNSFVKTVGNDSGVNVLFEQGLASVQERSGQDSNSSSTVSSFNVLSVSQINQLR